ncbi:uncharacterized protein LOC123723490 [Papilio machaon]|uniref:uncharacterized protein LOC123723490 n=1 Tax=Papilio machaon TaxID=76193 RepID=UPI001E664BF3|nr:uncharacterized protein LOC123723490 [Papilio machaon]
MCGLRILIVLLVLKAASLLQGLQMQSLKNVPGIFPVKEGKAVISREKWTLIRILDLNNIQDDLTLNINKLKELNTLIEANFNQTYINVVFRNFRIQVEYIKNVTLNKYKQLVPSFRVKRGLINPLGSIIKTITGNLDHEDARRYDRIIGEIKTKQNALNYKITLVTDFIENLNNWSVSVYNNINQLNDNFNIVQNNLENIKEQERTAFNTNIIVHTYSLILHNFQSLYSKLGEIETAIAFSKLKTLHQSIVDSEKLLIVLKDIEKSARFAFSVSLDNLVKIEQTITIKAYCKENQLTFLLEIPLIEKETYTYYKLYPTPISRDHDTYVILPKYPYMIVNGLNSEPLAEPCTATTPSNFICYVDSTSQILEDRCITDIMKYATNLSSCEFIPVVIDNILLHHIQPNRWIIFVKQNTLLQQQCNNDIFQRYVQGSHVITIEDQACEVKIDKFTLKVHPQMTELMQYLKLPVISLPHISNVKTRQRKPIMMEDMNLKNMQLLVKSVKSVSESEVEIGKIRVYSVSVWTIILYLIIAVFIVVIWYIRLKKLDYTCNFRNSQNTDDSDNFESQGGEVMRRNSRTTQQMPTRTILIPGEIRHL